jgi:hypothetical protein
LRFHACNQRVVRAAAAARPAPTAPEARLLVCGIVGSRSRSSGDLKKGEKHNNKIKK